MLEDQELEGLLADIESDRVERKSSLSDPNKILEAICAFANDMPGHRKPGVIFIGVKDNGDCANLPIDDRFLLTLSSMRSDGNILPIPTINVVKRKLAGCEMAVVVVEPADAPPVRLRGVIWIRVGSRRAIASPQEGRILTEKRRYRNIPFDISPVSDADITALNLNVFKDSYLPLAISPEIIQLNDRRIEEQLASLRFAALKPDFTPTVLGILTVGKDTLRYIPGAYVQFLRIDGNELSDPIKDQKQMVGPLPDLLSGLDEVFKAHIRSATDITSQTLEIRYPDYPLDALRQLARNAIMHRTYENTYSPVRITWFNDRIEIQNPGGAYGLVTSDNLGQPGITDYRNPNLAEAMKILGYVQKFGVGIQVARSEMAKNGNPAPEFNVQPNLVLVTLRRRP